MNARDEMLAELDYMADVVECYQTSRTLTQSTAKLRNGETLTESEADIVETELIAMSDTDFIWESRRMRRAMNLLAHEIGTLERHNPDAVCTGRIPTITVDGVKYEGIV